MCFLFTRFFQQQSKQAANTKSKNAAATDEHDYDGSDVEIDSDISDEEFDKILGKLIL